MAFIDQAGTILVTSSSFSISHPRGFGDQSIEEKVSCKATMSLQDNWRAIKISSCAAGRH